MTRPLQAPGYWTRTQFWAIAAALFVAQIGLIWVFAARGAKTPAPPGPDFVVRLSARPVDQGQLATALFAEDPTLFQAPAQHGFSGRAWMTAPTPAYHAAETPVPDVSLSLNGGVWKPRALPAPQPHEAPLTIKVPDGTDFEPDSIISAPNAAPKTSTMHLEGTLARRRVISRAVTLPAQPAVQLLSNSVVQLAVNAAGEVMSTRLEGSSGSTSADAAALNTSRRLRFVPDTKPGATVERGRAIFSWQTIESAAGN